jgi:hypothetical protein
MENNDKIFSDKNINKIFVDIKPEKGEKINIFKNEEFEIKYLIRKGKVFILKANLL